MATGYTRQEAGNIIIGATIQPSHFNNEFNALAAFADASTGHNHDGTTGGGAQIPLGTSVTGTLGADNGGTGLTSVTDGGIMLGSGTDAVTVTSQPTNGQLLIGSTGSDPVLATLTDGTYVTATEGAGTITLDAAVTVVGSLTADSGTATATANTLQIAGGEGIDTSASGSTVTISLEDSVVKSIGTDSGTVTPAGNSVNIVGGTVINTSAVSGEVKLTVVNATDTQKGAASFDSADFTVSSGAVSLEAAVPKTDEANEYTKTQNFNATSLTSSSNSIAWDASSNQVAKHTFTENTTLANPTNLVDGATYILILTQHASSPKTLAFGSAYKFPGGNAFTVTATNSAVDIMTFVSDGTNMYSVGQADFS